jgi:hypothetical protein
MTIVSFHVLIEMLAGTPPNYEPPLFCAGTMQDALYHFALEPTKIKLGKVDMDHHSCVFLDIGDAFNVSSIEMKMYSAVDQLQAQSAETVLLCSDEGNADELPGTLADIHLDMDGSTKNALAHRDTASSFAAIKIKRHSSEASMEFDDAGMEIVAATTNVCS